MRQDNSVKPEACNPLGLSACAKARDGTRDRAPRRAPASTIERALLKAMLMSLGNPPVALVPWGGQAITSGNGEAGHLKVHILDPGALLRLALDPLFQFGELYSLGRIEVEGDLTALIETINEAMGIKPGWGSRLLGLIHAPRSNLLGRSSANIHHHYDLGNDFYALWLDRQLLYTCAYFPEPLTGLEDAQVAKMDHICRKLRLRPGDRVVEAGCGWGALALHMARRYGASVRAYNLSREQITYAKARARAEGLDQRVDFVEDDYRAIRGQYDVFVSVGMLEHVGRNHYRELGQVIDRCLDKRGRGFIHAIGTDHAAPLNPWIERRIFPGAYPPTLREMMAVFEPAGLSVLDVENLRLHYAKTLEHWLARFETSADRVEAMFGPLFVRAWRLYLCGSLAAFRSGNLQLFQVLFQRNGDNDLPWTRAHLYGDGHAPWTTPTS
jgi:cyclopropane-fatty-acyl-phospholipid synthase